MASTPRKGRSKKNTVLDAPPVVATKIATPLPIEEFSYELRIPRERVAVLIGKKGETKRQLEQETQTQLAIDSGEGEIEITGKDALLLYLCREIVRAIGRGFNPEIAMQLLKGDYAFEIISIVDYARNANDLERLRGRVIGEGGKSRRTIEDLTGVSMCIFRQTVGFIGSGENLTIARRAVESLLTGSPHAHVYRWLERKRREQRIL